MYSENITYAFETEAGVPTSSISSKRPDEKKTNNTHVICGQYESDSFKNHPAIQTAITNEKITANELTILFSKLGDNIKNNNIQYLLKYKKITLRQLASLSNNQILALTTTDSIAASAVILSDNIYNLFLTLHDKTMGEINQLLDPHCPTRLSLDTLKFTFDTKQNDLGVRFTLDQRNALFAKFEKTTLKRRHPTFDSVRNFFYLDIENTASFQKVTATIRQSALDQLDAEINAIKIDSGDNKQNRILDLLSKAHNMQIFKDHRSNYKLFGAWGRTQASIAIDKLIDKHQIIVANVDRLKI